MSPDASGIVYRRLRAPRQPGGVLVDPPPDQIAATWTQNRNRPVATAPDLQGRSLDTLALSTRRLLVDLARNYSEQYADPLSTLVAPGESPPIVLTGHQPQLFHPGVWFKNFMLDAVGRAHGAIAINLLIDNDTLRSPTLKVPTGSPHEPRVEVVAMDRHRDEVPFEERRIADPRQFTGFGPRVEQCVGSLVSDPLIRQLWPRAVDAARRTPQLGQCLAQARHELERTWGLTTLELPLSALVETEPFRWLVVHLLVDLSRFRGVYNESLAEFRRVNRVRSRTHPVPDLQAVDAWLEAPFWIWSTDDPQRRRLYVRRQGRQLILSDQQARRVALDVGDEGDAGTAVAQLADWSRQGVKLRPRALITTLFARLLACDLFIHGIGGAKYDQVTDVLIRRFFGIEPPRFLTVTLTAQLPIPHPVVTRDDVRRASGWLRELRFHGERLLTGDLAGVPPDHAPLRDPLPADAARLIAEKRTWLVTQPPRGAGRERHAALARLNQELAALLEQRRTAIVAYREQQAILAARHALLASREYSFCLFPEAALRPLLAARCPGR